MSKITSSISDIKVSSIALGFTVGFGVFTTWNAIKQTRASTNPWKSVYIYLIWGEMAANVAMTVEAYLLISEVTGLTYDFQSPHACILSHLSVRKLTSMSLIVLRLLLYFVSCQKSAILS